MSLAVKLIAMMGGLFPASFVTEHHYAPATASQAVSFSGAQAGDLAIIIVENSAFSISTPSGWTLVDSYAWATFGYHTAVFSKLLTAGDISTGSVTMTGLDAADSIVMFLAYRGAVTVTAVSNADVQTSNITIPGFTKNSASKGIVTYCQSRSPASTMTPPAGAASRTARLQTANFSARANDILADYVDGTGLTYTAANPALQECVAGALELT